MERLSRTDALKKIRGHLGDGFIIPTSHFKESMKKRRHSMPDVIHAIRFGLIFEEPEQDIKTGEWKYRVEGESVDGEPLRVVIAIVADDVSKYLTVF